MTTQQPDKKQTLTPAQDALCNQMVRSSIHSAIYLESIAKFISDVTAWVATNTNADGSTKANQEKTVPTEQKQVTTTLSGI
jgi:hypothetical protein